jgi:V/A-type H+-transporting ATPase subunit D
MIFNETIPTKGNLINLKKQLILATEGHNLLEKKRNIILKELVGLIDKAKELQDKIFDVFDKAYKSLQYSSIDLGIETIQEYAKGVPEYKAFKIRFRSIMGVEIPEMYKEDIKPSIPYEIYRTTPALDEAYLSFKYVLDLITVVAAIENSVYKLAYEAKKTSKRVSALENIVIPRLNESIKYIQDTLEEFEREEFFKLKKLKKS